MKLDVFLFLSAIVSSCVLLFSTAVSGCSCDVCTKWEEEYSGVQCDEWMTIMVPTAKPNGGAHMIPRMLCVRHSGCRECVEWGENGPEAPEGACYE